MTKYQYENKVVGVWLNPTLLDFLEEYACTMNVSKPSALEHILKVSKSKLEDTMYDEGAEKLFQDYQNTYVKQTLASYTKFKTKLSKKLRERGFAKEELQLLLGKLDNLWLKV
jgi:hypothetical protein